MIPRKRGKITIKAFEGRLHALKRRSQARDSAALLMRESFTARTIFLTTICSSVSESSCAIEMEGVGLLEGGGELCFLYLHRSRNI